MAEIELVIKIPEEEYEMIVNSEDCGLHTLTRAIAHGTMLPKGHGKLIDADSLKNQFPIWVDNFSSRLINNTISKTPTIIEADKGD